MNTRFLSCKGTYFFSKMGMFTLLRANLIKNYKYFIEAA